MQNILCDLVANSVKKIYIFLFLRFQTEVVLTNITTVTLTTILLQSRMYFLMLPGLETRAFDARHKFLSDSF